MASSGTLVGTTSLNKTQFKFFVTWKIINSEADRITYNRSQIEAKMWLERLGGYTFDSVNANKSHFLEITEYGEDTTNHRDAWTARTDFSPWPSSNPYLIRTLTAYVNHNADGTKTISIDAQYDTGTGTYFPGLCTTTQTNYTLDPIPRAMLRPKVSGTWRDPKAVYVRAGGVWVQAKQLWVRAGGSWKVTK